jgi:hypothetical protein
MPVVSCIDDFFDEVTDFNKCPTKLINGQIAWVPTLIPKPLPWVMDVERANPRSHDDIKYRIRSLQNNDFTYKKDRLPIHRINLHPTEELFAIIAKKRPCIMISQYLLGGLTTEQISSLTNGKLHLLQQEQIFLPIFSTEDDGSLSGFPQGFVKKIRQLVYPHLLYLPESASSKKRGKFNDILKEGIIRLDRIFSSIPHHAQISPTNIRISDEYLSILLEYISEYLLGKKSEELDALKDLCQSET